MYLVRRVQRLLIASITLLPALVTLGPWAAAEGLFKAPTRWTDWKYVTFCRIALWTVGGKLKILDPQRVAFVTGPPVVIVSNHESLLDGPAIVCALRQRSVRFVIKAELLRVPILGWSLAASGCVPVQRGTRAKDSMQRLNDAGVRSEADVVFFAEGTRSRDGTLRSFKKGAFHHAIATGRPILPVGIGGAYECLGPGSIDAESRPVVLALGEPIPVHNMTPDDVETLRDRVHAAVSQQRERALKAANSPRARA